MGFPLLLNAKLAVRRLALAWILTGATARFALAQDITTNLRGHWYLTETSGAVADDLSSFNCNGTYTNGVTLAGSTPVLLHQALAANFDGANDYVAIPSESTYDITGVITVAAWIKVDVWDVQWQAVAGKGDSAWRLLRDSLNGGVSFACTGLSNMRVSTTTAVNDGQWHHVVGIYNGSSLLIYLDGALNNSIAATGAIATNNFPVEIGRNAEAAGREFDGAIYDVRVYNRALSSLDVLYLTTQGKPVAQLKLDESSGTTAADSSGLSNNGTVAGTVDWTTAVRGNGHRFNYTNGDDYITLPSNWIMDGVQETNFTVAAWFMPLSTPPGTGSANDAAYGIFQKKGWHTGLYYTNANAFAIEHFTAGDVSRSATSTGIYSPGKFYHVVGTVNRSTGSTRLYIDGALVQATTFTPGASREYGAEPWRLGIGGPAMGTFKWPAHGVIDDAHLYLHAITPAEVATLHGLIGHWKFAEGTGTAAADSTLVANHSALVGGAAWTTDCAGDNALVTNGAGGIARTNAAVTPPSEGTVAFWMQPAASTALRRVCGIGGDWEIRQLPDGRLIFDLCGDGATIVGTIDPLDEAGRWYHVAATFNSANDTYSVYVDGELNASGVNSVNMVAQPAGVLSFGTRTGSTEYWPGALRDFRVYNRQLKAWEIAELAGLEGHWKFDETSGSAFADSSAWGRNGTVTGTPVWNSGKINNALQLNGANYATVPGLGSRPKNVTVSAWANLTTADSGGAELISLGDCFAIRLDNGGQCRAFFYNGSTWISASINQTVANTGWRHFAAVFDDDGNTFKLYINGAEAASVATTASIVYTGLGSNTILGRHGNGLSNSDFTGRIDDARVYSRALCPSEILQLYDSGNGGLQGVRIMQWVEAR